MPRSAHTVRIIAGNLRGRRIPVPPGDRVRPTQDRVREAVFSMLGPSLEGAVFLDAFAGTGANGFEALSRGARLAVMADSDPKQRDAIASAAEAMGVGGETRVVGVSLPGSPSALLSYGPYDIVYADPPYIFEGWDELLNVFSAEGVLAQGAIVIAEHSSKVELPERVGELSTEATRSYGDTSITRFAYGEPTLP